MDENIKAWLGPAADEMTDEQIKMVAAESRVIGERLPGPDREQERQDALNTYVQGLLHENKDEPVKHSYVVAYGAVAVDGRGTFQGHAVITQNVPLDAEHLDQTCETLRRSCPMRIGAPWIVSIWKLGV